MNGVHFNYTNAAPHGAHYRKERGKERERDKKKKGGGDWEDWDDRRRDEKDRKIRNEGRGMQENEGMERKPFEESSMLTAKGRTDVASGLTLQPFRVKINIKHK